jgi:plasmid stabilization system protein ParE
MNRYVLSPTAHADLERAHTLYYRIARGDVIDVVRVLHQRMDVDRHFD